VAGKLTREQLVQALAEASHRTFLRHARERGDAESTLSPELHPHDWERAEDAVLELERLGVWPPASYPIVPRAR
jgi:hypothetical protein